MSYEGERIAVAAVSWTSAFKGGEGARGARRRAKSGERRPLVMSCVRSGAEWVGGARDFPRESVPLAESRLANPRFSRDVARIANTLHLIGQSISR